MRFFRALIPANAFEYLVLMLVTYGIAYWAVFIHLELAVDIEETQVSYIERNLPMALCVIVAVLGFQWITAGRRLTHGGRPTSQAWVVVLPVIGVLYAISLLVLAAPKEMGSAPGGANPLDPGAWAQHQNGPGGSGGLTFQGKTVGLPGDERRAA